MSETSFFVRPLEIAFFGPPDAQSAGETHYARSLFPPPPRTFQGLVRSRLLAAATPALDLSDGSPKAKRERAALVGGSETLPTGWQIEGPLPAAWSSEHEHLVPWLPAPMFLRRRKEGADPREPAVARMVALVREDRARGGVAGAPSNPTNATHVIGTRGFADSGPYDRWLSATNLYWALTGKGEWNVEGSSRLPPMVRREQRVGLAVDAQSRRARDRMLYAVDQLRFDGEGGFLGALHATLPSALSGAALQTGTVPFGRWNRLAALEQTPKLDPHWTRLVNGEHLPAEPQESARFWLVLITPARLKDPLSPVIQDVRGSESFHTLGALLGAPMQLGGFSIAERRARPNQHYVPAGSAWLFELPNVSRSRRGELVRALHGSHCLGPREEARMGFGRVLVGIEREG